MPSSEFYTGESLLNGKDFSYRQLCEFFLLTLTLNYTVSLSKAIPISNMYALLDVYVSKMLHIAI